MQLLNRLDRKAVPHPPTNLLTGKVVTKHFADFLSRKFNFLIEVTSTEESLMTIGRKGSQMSAQIINAGEEGRIFVQIFSNGSYNVVMPANNLPSPGTSVKSPYLPPPDAPPPSSPSSRPSTPAAPGASGELANSASNAKNVGRLAKGAQVLSTALKVYTTVKALEYANNGEYVNASVAAASIAVPEIQSIYDAAEILGETFSGFETELQNNIRTYQPSTFNQGW
jgi:hypothetical protein